MTQFIPQNLTLVRQRMAAACRAAGRAPADVRLVAVSKTFAPRLIEAAVDSGQLEFGESYVQEALVKIGVLPRAGLVWHFIGPVQANKTRDIATHFDWVHGIDRERIARRLAEQRPAQLPPLNVCVQVNISGEASKSGVAPEAAPALCRSVAALPRLQLRGLMAIPAPRLGDRDARAPYRALRRLFETIRQDLDSRHFDTLSAGMSDDLEDAIAEGATLVRVGTAIFGSRGNKP